MQFDEFVEKEKVPKAVVEMADEAIVHGGLKYGQVWYGYTRGSEAYVMLTGCPDIEDHELVSHGFIRIYVSPAPALDVTVGWAWFSKAVAVTP